MPTFEPVRYAALTDVGVKRSHNQDACAAQPAPDRDAWEEHGHLFVVADGMGGHAVGEKASAKAVRDVPFLFQKHAADGVLVALRKTFQETNAGIHAIGQENPEFRGMGTTGTALVLRPEGAWVGHVGDSRAYRIRGGQAEQLTFDHSWVWEVARRQGLDPDQMGDFKKNVIIRSLGPDPEVEVDVEGPHPVRPGDKFLLCSDGLSNQVPGDEIGAIVAAFPPDEAARFLVELANLRGGPDNITVLIVHAPGKAGDADGDAPAAPSAVGRLVAKWGRKVPWPFAALAAGLLLAVGSFALHAAEVPGASVLFLLAAGVILGGLAGLVRFFLRDPRAGSDPSADPSTPRELNVYKTYDSKPTAALLDRLGQLESNLIDAMRAQETPSDWDAHAKLATAAEAEAKKGPSLAAFRARCRSLGLLAHWFNRSRAKNESFRPNW